MRFAAKPVKAEVLEEFFDLEHSDGAIEFKVTAEVYKKPDKLTCPYVRYKFTTEVLGGGSTREIVRTMPEIEALARMLDRIITRQGS